MKNIENSNVWQNYENSGKIESKFLRANCIILKDIKQNLNFRQNILKNNHSDWQFSYIICTFENMRQTATLEKVIASVEKTQICDSNTIYMFFIHRKSATLNKIVPPVKKHQMPSPLQIFKHLFMYVHVTLHEKVEIK